jgi:hypothetical protein
MLLGLLVWGGGEVPCPSQQHAGPSVPREGAEVAGESPVVEADPCTAQERDQRPRVVETGALVPSGEQGVEPRLEGAALRGPAQHPDGGPEAPAAHVHALRRGLHVQGEQRHRVEGRALARRGLVMCAQIAGVQARVQRVEHLLQRERMLHRRESGTPSQDGEPSARGGLLTHAAHAEVLGLQPGGRGADGLLERGPRRRGAGAVGCGGLRHRCSTPRKGRVPASRRRGGWVRAAV